MIDTTKIKETIDKIRDHIKRAIDDKTITDADIKKAYGISDQLLDFFKGKKQEWYQLFYDFLDDQVVKYSIKDIRADFDGYRYFVPDFVKFVLDPLEEQEKQEKKNKKKPDNANEEDDKKLKKVVKKDGAKK